MSRTGIVRGLDDQFSHHHRASLALVRSVPPEKLYWQPGVASVFPADSCGEHLLRSAAAVEQTFGGIATNLWDDPFEWTLPEALATPEQVEHYMVEAEATRRRGFALLRSDQDLLKMIAAPAGEMRPLFQVIVETLARAAHYQGRAFAVFRLFSNGRLPSI